MAVSRLINLFESLDSVPKITRKARRPTSLPAGMDDSTSFADFSLSLQTGFTNNHHHSSSHTSMASMTSSSLTASPSSSYRAKKRNSRSYSPIFSPSSSCPRSPYLLRRQPSSIDLALQAERLAPGPVGLGLSMMEPRPVIEVPVSVGTSHIFDGTSFEEEKQPFVMGGILEVMEEES